MSIFKNVKSLFVVEEEQTGSANAKKPEPVIKPVENISSETTEPMSQSKEGSPGKAEKKFTDILFKAMQDNDQEGFDYLEYKQSLLSLKKMPMDEATRYKSAYAMAETMGVSPTHLLGTAKHYVKVLQTEEKKFEEAMNAKLQQNVTGREQKMAKLAEGIAAKQEQIRKLQAEIDAGQKEITKTKQQIQGSLSKMQTIKNNFIASYNVIASQIENDIVNMQKYLK